jgi:hypothetical protein
LIRVENINANLIEMSRQMEINTPLMEIAHRNATHYKNDVNEPVYDKKPFEFEYIPEYNSFYSDELIKAVEHKYAKDIKIFDYTFND